ncbi:MAG: MFS transporter [Dehalococcoidia bacterium]|jgi:MFS family permease|nr:MFS transporter [Dehalococcoidia bacterium]
MNHARLPFYGWVVVAAAFAAMSGLGEVQYSFGVFFKALENEFGWTRALTASGFTSLAIGLGLSSIAYGWLTDRYSPRPVLFVATLVTGISLMLCSRIETLVQLQVLLFATGLGVGGVTPVSTATVARWFENRSGGGIALGVTMAGLGMGAIVYAPVLSRLIPVLGWRACFLVAGMAFLVVVGLAALAMKPSNLTSARADSSATGLPSEVAPMSRVRLLRSREFLQLVLIMVVTTFSFQVVTVHLVPYAVDIGISQIAAAGALGFMGGMSVPGRLSSGVLSTRLGWGKTLVIAQFGMAAAILSLPFVRQESMLYAVAGLYGFCQGVRSVSVLGVLGHIFGMRNVGGSTGVMLAIAQTAGAAGPLLAGYLFDRWGSYSITFIPLGVVILVVAALSIRLGIGSSMTAHGSSRGA